ncbi:hypothetical protein FIA58_019750 [Flavobacterium jejuense]|uniref:DUF4932 domain-containing protein n=1 Tax=Flavobacterium jejuense TaxID=1544455 RepID=A0ABX0IWT5_9FLAO|nr:hypothetical protein [Flavobacterium jejuense]NHN27918.1 hypothetical protein [Flavobacterium jejuense]
MKKRVLFLSILLCVFYSIGQNNKQKIEVQLSSRVDMASKEVNEIVVLYENYLNSNPHIISDNPFWNRKEKELYKDFDFSRASMFQSGMTTEQLCNIFSPFVMSVEPYGKKYQIRILFSMPTNNPEYLRSKVWCIQKLNAIKEGQKWVLENLIVELTKEWKSNTIGTIEYVYPNSHVFNRDEAKLSEVFCEDIISRFNPNYNTTFKFYLTNNIDDMGLLENFDYYYVGITKGKARENMILTARGNEYFPHELVHKLLPENKKRGHIIEEGLAVFLGTKVNFLEYEKMRLELANDLINNRTKINFKSVVSQEVSFNGYQTAYPAGGAICELVYNKAGDKGLLQLMIANTESYGAIILELTKITNLKLEEIIKEWNKLILKN